MLTVHHLQMSQSERILWLCEELGLDYVCRVHERDPVTFQAPQSLRKCHPMGLAPVISDGEVLLAESGAIVEYLVAKYGDGRLIPKSQHPHYESFLYWFHFANGTLMPSELIRCIYERSIDKENNILRSFSDRANIAFVQIEDRLRTVDYLAGPEFTAADIMNFFPLTTMCRLSGRRFEQMPAISEYVDRIKSRSAYRRAAERGG